jgi:G:T/U-mismatch repair DNA glycosylase
LYTTLNDYEEEPHPWSPFIPLGADKLILGTFPTAIRNRGTYEFYYPNLNNEFWTVMFNLVGKELIDFMQHDPLTIRKQILAELTLGIADMGKRVLRQRDSSSDGNIFPLEFTNIFLLLEQHPSIKKVIITSSTGANSVLSWFEHYCKMNGVTLNYTSSSKLPRDFTFTLAGTTLIGTVIPSSSRASRYKGDKLIPFYRNAILNTPE